MGGGYDTAPLSLPALDATALAMLPVVFAACLGFFCFKGNASRLRQRFSSLWFYCSPNERWSVRTDSYSFVSNRVVDDAGSARGAGWKSSAASGEMGGGSR